MGSTGELRLDEAARLPDLVVLVLNSYRISPPTLAIQELRGEPILVLSDLHADPHRPIILPESIYVDHLGWPVYGTIRQLLVRMVERETDKEAPLALEYGGKVPIRPTSMTAVGGPTVSFNPNFTAYQSTVGFFGGYQLPVPSGFRGLHLLAGIRPTASGRRARPIEATRLKGGGLRVRLAVPIDAGPEVWGARDEGQPIDVFAVSGSGKRCEWLLELE